MPLLVPRNKAVKSKKKIQYSKETEPSPGRVFSFCVTNTPVSTPGEKLGLLAVRAAPCLKSKIWC